MKNIEHTKTTPTYVVAVILLLALTYIQFFGSFVIFISLTQCLIAAFVVLLVALSFVFINRYNLTSLDKIVLFFFVFTLLSFFYSVEYNGQSSRGLIPKYLNYFGILFYFVLKRWRVSSRNTLLIVLIISVSMICCYMFQYFSYPNVYFADANHNVFDDMGIFRMRFPCTICAYLTFMYGLNQYFITNRLSKLLFTILATGPIIIMEFRTLTILTIVAAIFFTIANNRKSIFKYFKYLVVLSIFGYVALETPLVQDKIASMIERQSRDDVMDVHNTRFTSVLYHGILFLQEPVGWIIGNGEPLVGEDGMDDPGNDYQRTMYQAYILDMFWVDTGFWGLSGIIGIPATILLMSMYYYLIKNCKRKNELFLRYSMFVVMIGSLFTTMEAYRNGNIMILGMLLYFFSEKRREEENIISYKKTLK